MKCFIDFDDTLIHRSRMTDDIYAAFVEVPVDTLRKHYIDYRENHPFTITGFTTYLTNLGINGERLRELFFTFARRANEYVFPDAIAVVEKLKTDGLACILLSFDAEPETWQKPKIDASGITPLFDGIWITSENKVALLRSWNINQPFVFIDDKQSEIEAMQAAFPESLCIKHDVGAPLLPHLAQIEAFAKQHQS